MFKTTGILDKHFYDNYSYILFGKIIRAYIIVGLCVIIFFYFIGFTTVNLIVSAGAVTIVCALSVILSLIRTKKIILNRIFEIYGDHSYAYTSYFEKDGVYSETSNSTVKLNYDDFVKLKKCKSVYFLFTKTNLFVPIFVEKFSCEEKKELLKFFKKHLPNIKKF